jgi:hypothetical protein
MESLNGHRRLLPRVHEHETNKELFWQVEVPADDRVKLSLEGRLLTVRVVHPAADKPDLRVHPEVASI